MQVKLALSLKNISVSILVVTAFLIPLFFTPLTTEFFDTAKLALLIITVAALLIIKSVSFCTKGRVLFNHSALDIPILLFLLAIILSSLIPPAMLSYYRNIAFLGSANRIHGSAVSWIIYALLFFLITNNIKSPTQIKYLIYAFLASSVLVSLITLISYLGLYLPPQFAQVANFTPTGSSFSTAALVTLLLPMLLLTIIYPQTILERNFSIALATLFGLVIVAVGTIANFAVVALSLLLIAAAQKKSLLNIYFFIPLLAAALILLMTAVVPIGPLRQKYLNFPREIQLPFQTSWKIAISTFRDAPFFGTGPGTYQSDFTLYKPVEFNATNFWGFRFDTSFNEYLQIFATSGGLGLLALTFLSITILRLGWKSYRDSLSFGHENFLSQALSISAICAVALLLLHPSTLVLSVTITYLLAILMIKGRYLEEVSVRMKTAKAYDNKAASLDLLPGILLLAAIVLVALAFWNGYKILLADYYHRQALNSATVKAIDTYNFLVKAEQLNPNIDIYRTDLAQTNFVLANSIASTKGPTQASPSGSLTESDKQNIQTLLSQSINEGRAAVTIDPLSAQNWEILASIYRQIAGVAQNALSFSLTAYGKAIERDPLNPLLRLNIGGVYYSVKNYDLAIRFFTDAVNIKPDFANGYYNLAVALKDKGDLSSAAAAASQAVALVDPKSQDYNTASKLLSDLKASLASQQNQGAQSGNVAGSQTNPPPAAQPTSALEQQQLPKVINLPQPEQVATPAAVKK